MLELQILFHNFVNATQLKRRWNEGLPISRMPVDENPNLQYCLLHQQLQLINCCIARCHRRAEALDALDALNDSQAATEVSLSSEEKLSAETEYAERCKHTHPARALYAKLKTGEHVLRLGADKPAGDLRLLETKELVFSPITQVGCVLLDSVPASSLYASFFSYRNGGLNWL